MDILLTRTPWKGFPVQGAELVIVADTNAFTNIDPTVEFKKPMSAEEKYRWVENEKSPKNFAKIMNSGDQLFFKILITKSVKGDCKKEGIKSIQSLSDHICHHPFAHSNFNCSNPVCYANCLHKKRVSDFEPSETPVIAVSSPGLEPGTH